MKSLPVGILTFVEIRAGEYYYVGRIMLIKGVINNGEKVTF